MTEVLSSMRRSWRVWAGFFSALLVVAAYVVVNQPSPATHQPADKVVASGSVLEKFDSDDQPVELLSGTLRTSKPTDLMLQVSLECSILTKLVTGPSTTPGATDTATAQGRVEVWVEIDPAGPAVPYTVPVTSDSNGDGTFDDPDDGEVVFCNRIYSRTVTDGEDEKDGLDEESDFIRTRNANAFNWLALDLGSGIRTITVRARLTIATFGDATAEALVGKRTLIVEPAKLANDASV